MSADARPTGDQSLDVESEVQRLYDTAGITRNKIGKHLRSQGIKISNNRIQQIIRSKGNTAKHASHRGILYEVSYDIEHRDTGYRTRITFTTRLRRVPKDAESETVQHKAHEHFESKVRHRGSPVRFVEGTVAIRLLRNPKYVN